MNLSGVSLFLSGIFRQVWQWKLLKTKWPKRKFMLHKVWVMDCKNLKICRQETQRPVGLTTGVKHGSMNELSRSSGSPLGRRMSTRFINTVVLTGEHVSEKWLDKQGRVWRHGPLSHCQEINAINLTMAFSYFIFMAIHAAVAEGDNNQRWHMGRKWAPTHRYLVGWI